MIKHLNGIEVVMTADEEAAQIVAAAAPKPPYVKSETEILADLLETKGLITPADRGR